MCSLAHFRRDGHPRLRFLDRTPPGGALSAVPTRSRFRSQSEQKEQVEDRARDEVRSVSSLVALLIVADLRRG